MGKRGRAKTPTTILKIRGSRQAEGREAEPHPDTGRPELPAGLPEDVVDVWEQVCPLLEGMGVLTITDGNALTRYCSMFVRWWKANQFLQKNGEKYPVYTTDKDGQTVVDQRTGRPAIRRFDKWPEVLICRDLANQLLRLEQEFGLTPSARAGLNVVVKKVSGLPSWEGQA